MIDFKTRGLDSGSCISLEVSIIAITCVSIDGFNCVFGSELDYKTRGLGSGSYLALEV